MTATTSNEPKGNVMLVDDDKFLLDMYSMKFSQAGFTVEACLSAQLALQILRDGFKANVVVFDLIMPELDGFAFLKLLSNEELAKGALKVALTNQYDEADKAKVMELGADRYILKASMIPSEVVSAVTEELAKKHPHS